MPAWSTPAIRRRANRSSNTSRTARSSCVKHPRPRPKRRACAGTPRPRGRRDGATGRRPSSRAHALRRDYAPDELEEAAQSAFSGRCSMADDGIDFPSKGISPTSAHAFPIGVACRAGNRMLPGCLRYRRSAEFGVVASGCARGLGGASRPWATARKPHPWGFLLIRFSKRLKEVRPPGFFEKIRNRPWARSPAHKLRAQRRAA